MKTSTTGMETNSKNENTVKNVGKLILSPKQKQSISRDKLNRMRQVFATVCNSQSMPIERLSDALVALGHDPQNDVSYQDFLAEHQLMDLSNVLDFEHYASIVLEYEEKMHIEDDALKQVDLKIAFEYFDLNKDNMIDSDELAMALNMLGFTITDQEAKEMIDFADHDKGTRT